MLDKQLKKYIQEKYHAQISLIFDRAKGLCVMDMCGRPQKANPRLSNYWDKHFKQQHSMCLNEAGVEYWRKRDERKQERVQKKKERVPQDGMPQSRPMMRPAAPEEKKEVQAAVLPFHPMTLNGIAVPDHQLLRMHPLMDMKQHSEFVDGARKARRVGEHRASSPPHAAPRCPPHVARFLVRAAASVAVFEQPAYATYAREYPTCSSNLTGCTNTPPFVRCRNADCPGMVCRTCQDRCICITCHNVACGECFFICSGEGETLCDMCSPWSACESCQSTFCERGVRACRTAASIAGPS